MKCQIGMTKDQKGFTMLEILVSLVIIALVLLSVFNHFINSARMNQKMARIRNVEVMSENLMEALKVCSLNQILMQFAVDDDGVSGLTDFELLPLWDGTQTYARELTRLEPSNPQITYWGNTTDLSADGVYELGIDSLSIGTQEYDVLVKLDYNSYTEEATGGVPSQNYNEYDLPILNQLDGEALVMLDSMQEVDGFSCDELAIQEFIRRRNLYIAKKDRENELAWENYYNLLAEAEASGKVLSPTPEEPPVYCSPSVYTAVELENEITKQVEIQLKRENDGTYRMTATAVYTVASELPMDADAILTSNEQQVYRQPISSQTFEQPIRYFFYFYTPTKCSKEVESIIWMNQQTDAEDHAVELAAYVILQNIGTESLSLNPYCKLMKGTPCDSTVSIYTNMEEGSRGYELSGFDASDIKGTVETKAYDQWICRIQIEVYEHEDRAEEKYHSLTYSLASTGVD